jgi:DNA-binding GntR family transcriptional regulator
VSLKDVGKRSIFTLVNLFHFRQQRELLITLTEFPADMLLESRSRAGTRVRIPTPEEVRGRCVVREALEAQSARLCCMHATMKERLDLRRMAEQLDTLYVRFQDDDDLELQFVVHTHHFELHMRIAEYARCPELHHAIEMNNVLVHNWFFDIAVGRRALPLGFHSQLMQAITGVDPLAADESMRAHVQYGVEETLQRILPSSTNNWRTRR